MKWTKASERLPEKCGEENSVIIRKKGEWVAYGFRNFSENDPQLYFTLGIRSCLTTSKQTNGQFWKNEIEWLDESEDTEGEIEAYSRELKNAVEAGQRHLKDNRALQSQLQSLEAENKELKGTIRKLIPLAKDGYKLHISNAVHQEFLDEDCEVISKANEALLIPK